MKSRLAIVACCLVAGGAFALLEPSAPIDVSTYLDYAHDTQGNTLGMWIGAKTKAPPVRLNLPFFDKMGVKKGEPNMGNVRDVINAEILHFEKNWAVLLVTTADTTLYYSVKVGTSADILGTAPTNTLLFSFAGNGGVVSYNPTNNTCQLYDTTLAPVGATRVVSGRPMPINGGAYFYCDDGGQAQVWRVKKGLDQAVNANGTFVMINEKKMLCCIEADPVHSLYSYK